MAENTFPVFSVEALVNFFRTEVLTGQEAKHFSKSDLVPAPKSEVIQTLYMRVLHLLFHFRPECHSMVPLQANLQYPQYQEGVISIVSVYVRMRQFLPMCLFFDFSMGDLLAPKKARTLTILSAIMNFLQFRMLKMELLLEKQSKFREDRDRLQTLVRSNKEAEKKVAVLTTIPPEQQAEADELCAALSELHSTTVQEYQEVNMKNDTIAEWKTNIAEKTQKLAQLKVEITNLKENITKLRSQIVESPEEFQSQMEKMRESVTNIKAAIKQADECVVELQSRVQTVEITALEIQQINQLLQELEESVNNSKQMQERNQELTAQYEKKQKELKNLCLEEGKLRRALGMKQDQESKQSIRRQKKKEMKEQHVQEVMGQCNLIHKKREEMADKIQEITNETQDLKDKMQSLRDECKQDTSRAQALFDALSAALANLHQQMDVNIQDITNDLSRKSANF